MNFGVNTADISILCIEDDADTCELIKFVFTGEGCQVTTCDNRECLKTIELETFSAVILDNYFGVLSGIEICRNSRAKHPQIPIIFFSGEARRSEIDKALDAGASMYLTKSNDFEKLVETTLRLIESSRQITAFN